jgi:molybdenum cofactor synthesis domain-containing protein
MRIFTGAPLPEGADAVVPQEDVTTDGERVRVRGRIAPGAYVRPAGEDVRTGDVVVEPGGPIGAAEVGLLATLGYSQVRVYRRPRVAILSTGNEIVEPGEPLAPGQIYDINRFTLASIVTAHGGVPVVLPSAPDTLDALSAAIDAALAEDVLVFSGGSSVGERDLILDVLKVRGEVVFHGVAVKPGKPTVFGRVAGKPVLGMPGYPTSCLSNGYMLLVPMLRRMARLPDHHPHVVRVPLARRIVSTTGRHQFYTVRVTDGSAVPAFKASGDITSMAHADGYIEIPAQVDIVEAGELVDVKLF